MSKDYLVIKEWSSLGIPCMIIRSSMGHLCGYVGVLAGHSWFEKNYNQCLLGCEKVPHKPHPFPGQSEDETIEWADMMNRISGGHWPCTWDEHHADIESIISVHGGVTFTGKYEEGGDDIWWIGFDCAHAGDYVPEIAKSLLEVGHFDHLLRDDTYRGEDYLIQETEQMAKQVKEYIT